MEASVSTLLCHPQVQQYLEQQHKKVECLNVIAMHLNDFLEESTITDVPQGFWMWLFLS